jgi:O-antigen/teichoic acid export membrane protein
MSQLFWSILLQWSRFGLNAVVFLLAARALSLHQFGAFATAFALITLTQGIHKAGIAETVVIKPATPLRLHALFGLAITFGFVLSAFYLLVALGMGFSCSLYFLAVIPPVLGVSAVSDGLLRKRLNIRALALRTAFAQIIAAAFAMGALYADAGIAALVIFAVLNTALSGIISILLAGWMPTRFPNYKYMMRTLKTVLRIVGRDVLNSGVLPLAQISIGIFIGLPSAGAFQIATRVLSMLDALTLAPLRYLALPKLASLKTSQRFDIEVRQCLHLSAILACWVWFGLASSTPQVLGLIVGDAHAVLVTPILHALIPLGLSAALAMTFTQALMAKGLTKLVLSRAMFTFGLSAALAMAMLQHSATHIAIGLSLANLLVLVWFLREALAKLSIQADAFKAIIPAVLSGIVMLLMLSTIAQPMAIRIALGTAVYAVILAALSFRPMAKLST